MDKPTLRQELIEILELKRLRPTSTMKTIGGIELCDGELLEIQKEEAVDLILSLLQEKIMEVIPTIRPITGKYTVERINGYNSAISTVKENVGRLFQ